MTNITDKAVTEYLSNRFEEQCEKFPKTRELSKENYIKTNFKIAKENMENRSLTNKEKYAATYTQAFIDSYPQLPAEHSKELIEKALKVALENIDAVLISGAAFALTSKRLGIKHTKKAIKEFLNANA